MRIAITGSHGVGKTTLVEELVAQLPGHASVEEPFYLLEDEGDAAPATPDRAHFERQLQRSIQAIGESGANTVFDRSPLDLVAYLQTLDASFDPQPWWETLAAAMARLELLVFVPIESPDRIELDAEDDADWRRRVDEALRDLVLDDTWGFGIPTLEVRGSVEERAGQVLDLLSRD